MTGVEALGILRGRRALLGNQAQLLRSLGESGAHLDLEAEALSWAITFIEAAQ